MEIQSDDDLRVAARGKLVRWQNGFEVAADVVVVVEFAVDDCVEAVGRRIEGLGGGRGQVID